MATIVRDETVANISTGGGGWTTYFVKRFYGGTAIAPSFASNASGDTGQYGSLAITFQGTSVAFIGNTPNALSSQWAFVSIDGGSQYNISYMDTAPPSARQWFQSPTLSDGTHTVNISRIAGTSIDFVVITAGQNTPLSAGETLIVDDGDPSITYTGSWELNTNPYTSGLSPHINLPYGNSTHQTNSAGASATFRFSGSNLTVWGVSTFNVLGNLTVTYTMDGYSVNTTYSVDAITPEYINQANQLDYFRLFYDNTSHPGDHTLEIKVKNSVMLNLEIDYITYTPSFNTLASKPNISQSGSTPTPKSAITGSTSTPKTAIAGVVVGGVIFLVLLVLLFLWYIRVSNRRLSLPAMQSAVSSTFKFRDHPNTRSIQPFVLAEPTNPFNAEATAGDEKTNPRLISLHQPGDQSFGSAAATTPAPLLSDFAPETGILAGGLPQSQSRMRLQGLMQAFIRELGFSEIVQVAGHDVERGRTGQMSMERPPPPAYEIEDRSSA